MYVTEEIRFRQKLIRIVDRSDWGVVDEYLVDELADDSDDEKRLFRARKEREVKHRCAASAESAKKKPRMVEATRPEDGGARRQPPGPLKSRLIGLWYTCAQWGHLARTCPRNYQKPYPFDHSVVSASGILCVDDSNPEWLWVPHAKVKVVSQR